MTVTEPTTVTFCQEPNCRCCATTLGGQPLSGFGMLGPSARIPVPIYKRTFMDTLVIGMHDHQRV